MFTVLNPAVVIAATDWKKDSQTESPGVVTNSVNVPNATITTVERQISLVVKEISLVRRQIKLNRSVTTIKPIAPANIRHDITKLIVLLSAKVSKLLFQREKPAVQKAETLWKTLYQAACQIV